MTSAALAQRHTIADTLLKEGVIDRDQYSKALEEYERSRRSLVRILVDMGVLSERKRLEILQRSLNMKVVSLRDVAPRSDVYGFVTREACRKRLVVPLKIEDGQVLLAMEDPSDVRTVSDMEKMFGLPVKSVLASDREILDCIEKLPPDLPETRNGAAVDTVAEETMGLVSSLCLLAMALGPMGLFYYIISATEWGKEAYAGLDFSMFENVLVFVVVWGSWAAVAYFINDLIFGKKAK